MNPVLAFVTQQSISLAHLPLTIFWIILCLSLCLKRKRKGNNRLKIDTVLRADMVTSLKFLIKGRGNLQFWQVNLLFQFITIPFLNLWFSMKRPSPTLLRTFLFYGSNSKKLAWNTVSSNKIIVHEPALSQCSNFVPPKKLKKPCV